MKSCAVVSHRPTRFKFGYGEILLRLKEQPDYSDIELAVVIPFSDHDVEWDEKNRNRLKFLISHSAEYINMEADKKQAHFARSQYMIDRSDVLVAVYDNDRTVKNNVRRAVVYAEKKGVPILFIHPDTGIISVRGESPARSNQFALLRCKPIACTMHSLDVLLIFGANPHLLS